MLKFPAALLLRLTLLAMLAIQMKAKSNIEMIFDECKCSSMDPHGYLANLSCFVSKNVKRRTFSIGFQLKKQINKFDINLSVELPRKPRNFVLFNFTNLNGCQILANSNQVTLVQIGMSILSRYSNLPKQCPMKENVQYYIRNYRMDMKLFPAFTFETTMNVNFEYIVHGNKMMSGFIQGHTVIRKTKAG